MTKAGLFPSSRCALRRWSGVCFSRSTCSETAHSERRHQRDVRAEKANATRSTRRFSL